MSEVKTVKIKANFMVVITADGRILRQGYYKLGLLSTSFSEMEQLVQELIAKLVSFGSVVDLLLIENNMLVKNIQLLEKLNKHYKFKPTEIKNLVKKIDGIREERNRLIHGTWTLGLNAQTKKPIVAVSEHKLKHINDENGEYWRKVTSKQYTFQELDQLIKDTKEINKQLKNLIKERI